MKDGRTRDLVEMLQFMVGESATVRDEIESGKRRMELAMKLCALRQEWGVSQAEFATRLGISRATVARMEQNDIDALTLPVIQKVAAAAGLEFYWEVREPKRKSKKAA